ncbi:DNA polymerase III subunit delta [Fructobacillus evanidus]|uniref:Delta prime subunit (HolB) n=1 Tax=Fructobacillus evanidus TaxID=3064281 RepID=A0ABM9MRP3_9LACO|nr:DNA polymerase III [Fructobacillus sp. LMG 32999]CAK1235234.1 DNA polymerase III [Fructobacillus sp. LMG 32999]CAK1235378.1 DNA polymerase III [Fructobacillus sp. LMG 32999]CAK1235676.1 DNA polymerase III [Fructobacillus sp. LMG 32999]CAK1238060.1 DNA polymerase III [Fructobacillus sp. LMG 32999]
MAKKNSNKGQTAQNTAEPALVDQDFQAMAEAAYPANYRHFEQAVAEDRLSHLYLLAGVGNAEKIALAKSLASFVLGQDELTKQRLAAFDHPDFVTVLPEKPGAAIKIAQIRALVPELTTTALEGQRKIFVIDQADTLTTAAANSLLKFIEEPAGPQLILLLANKASDVLATIRSRAQLVNLQASDQVNLDSQVAKEAFTKEAQTKVFKWFELAMTQDVALMAYLQGQLLPLVTAKDQENQVLAWLQSLGRDLAVYSYVDQNQLAFPQLLGFYKEMVKRYRPEQLLAVGKLILQTDQLKNVNISWQSRLEKLGLEITIALG